MTEASMLAVKLKSEGVKVVQLFEGLADDQWTIEIYSEDEKWTVRNILFHLMTSERAFVKLFEAIRKGGTGVTEDFVIDRYNARQQEKTKQLSPSDLLTNYKSARKEMVVWVSEIQDADLEKIGRHPYLGRTTLREMIKMVYIHNQVHYRDLRKILR